MKTIKKLLSLILTITILVTVFVVPAYAATAVTQTDGTLGTWNYTLVDGNATDVYCTSELSGEVVIPSELDGYSVVSIKGTGSNKNMFNDSENFNITSITIPNSVTSIGNSFYNCTSLTSITIPNSVTSIGEGAFAGCTSLTSITIPDSVISIRDGAFQRCTGLTSITIPNSVTSIGNRAFEGCTSLTSITIPNSVTSIGNSAFSGPDKNITTIKVASGSYAETWAISDGFTNIEYIYEEPNSTTSVNGTIQPIIIAFTVPTDAGFTLNPNAETPEENFVSPKFTVTNDCNAPLKLSVGNFEVNPDSEHVFIDVAPDLYTLEEWAKLNKTESESEIALGILKQGSPESEAVYVVDVTEPINIGEIKPYADIDFIFVAKHGNAFSKQITTEYKITWILELN